MLNYRHMSMIQIKKAGVRLVKVSAAQANRRIDNFIIRELAKVPKTRIYQMLRRGEVRVNGGRVKQDYRLQPGDQVRIPPVHYRESDKKTIPNKRLIDLLQDSVIFENRELIVLNKPAGIAVHSGSGQAVGVIETLRHLRPADADLQLAHRLDRDTSGCLLIAKNIDCLRWLHDCLRDGRIEKQYFALLQGNLDGRMLEVSVPVRKNVARSGERMTAATEQGKSALTRFIRDRTYRGATLARVQINTGRTHQIRVHASYIKHPIAGDGKYGDREFNRKMRKLGLKRLFLHAASLKLPAFPGRQKPLAIDAPLPAELAGFLLGLS